MRANDKRVLKNAAEHAQNGDDKRNRKADPVSWMSWDAIKEASVNTGLTQKGSCNAVTCRRNSWKGSAKESCKVLGKEKVHRHALQKWATHIAGESEP